MIIDVQVKAFLTIEVLMFQTLILVPADVDKLRLLTAGTKIKIWNIKTFERQKCLNLNINYHVQFSSDLKNS